MDVFKQQYQRIQEQLAGLNGTQRMLVLSLVAVMVLTLVLWSRFAATPDSVPLLMQAVREQDQARIVNALTQRGIRHTLSGGNIMVSPDDRMRAFATITAENLVPSGSSNLLDDFLSRGTPFDSQDKNSKVWKLLLAQNIQSTLTMMPGVRDARVTIDTNNVPRFGGSINPTASVFLFMQNPGERLSRSAVEGVAAFVTGSVAGMKRTDVQVIVDGRPHSLDATVAGGGASDILERISEYETYFAGKVVGRLSYIPGVHVAVSAKLNNESKESVIRSIDDIKSKETEITSRTSESVSEGPGQTDPGVGANTGGELSIQASAGGTTTTTEESVTKMENFPTHREEHMRVGGGDAVPTSATVAIPRSWFVKQLKDVDPTSTKEPDLAAIEQKIAAEQAVIQETVQKTLALADASSVQITTYVDPPAELPGAGSGGSGLFGFTVGGNMKEILIGVLALVSLFMISMIVKKECPRPAGDS